MTSDAFTGRTKRARKKDFCQGRGSQTPTSILIKQICHKSFYKCSAGGYSSWWKYPIHAGSSPTGLKSRLLARLSVLTASDPPAICRVGWPVLRGLCVPTLKRFSHKTDKKTKQYKTKQKSKSEGTPNCTSQFSPFAAQTSNYQWQQHT